MGGSEPGALDLPKRIAKPARRALHGAGVLSMRDLERFSRAELLALHGFGPKALEVLGPELDKAGLRLRD
ncbi:hypothetical protein [Frigidibacter sp. ROC022]|uniref:hypothetical protein n=1 Tax=Frigidibacter sp. ROC022 TaxID=2971796 RepID=UPI00215A78B6|nr:hypothetical protein [Frigidibacter sp. ROC022]MCR8726419.1 hypothetical protein [Frigidibacter sp. ROC022]